MRPSRALAAIAASTAVLAPAGPAGAADLRPTVRVETLTATITGPLRSGWARSYVDADGTARALPARTALGQLAAVAARLDQPLRITYFPSFESGLVTAFAGAEAPPSGGWQFAVDGAQPPVGADAIQLPPRAEVVWWLIDDFGSQGNYMPLDLDVVRRTSRSVTFRVTRWNGTAVAGASTATLRVNGRAYAVPASGRVRIATRPGRRYVARATAPASIRSERIVVRG